MRQFFVRFFFEFLVIHESVKNYCFFLCSFLYRFFIFFLLSILASIWTPKWQPGVGSKAGVALRGGIKSGRIARICQNQGKLRFSLPVWCKMAPISCLYVAFFELLEAKLVQDGSNFMFFLQYFGASGASWNAFCEIVLVLMF